MNNFKGSLPYNLCYHGKLQNLTVYENHLSGELPKSLGNCSSLVELKIYKNEFYGKIPSGLFWSTNLVFFMISHNKFIGELPQNLSSNISLFDISYNKFYGRIPIGVSSWTNVVEFKASKNYLNGTFPQELTNLPKLETLLLDQNQLKGSLPNDMISWKSLVTLNLSQNQLNGQIPISIGHLPSLGVLDLSENQFTGEIPSILPRITNLNLSSNLFTGRVPSEFENPAFDRSFLNNSGLCADTPKLSLTLCNFGFKKLTKTSHWSLGLIISLILVTFLLALFALFLIIKLYRKRNQGFDNSSWKLISFQRLSFTESNIVSSLTEQNIIGSGGFGTVYRVPVDGLTYVAVKKITSNRKLRQKLETSFRAEVKILSNIRHRNIVKLLCCIYNVDSMMLVYEYLEHSSLDKWLHNKNKLSNMSGSARHVVLDWPKRLRIAIGIAHGLCYMHHDCSPPIVHRDIKTSNILLDSEFNAKVADFGLARLLIKAGQSNTMSAVIGSFGYMAPGKMNNMPILLFFLPTNIFLRI
jgi:tRNA A-37 threonylcarbamoyl transferase component Bud32